MMSQRESPKNHPWVLPNKVACLVWVPDSSLTVNDVSFNTRQERTTDWEKKIMGASWVLPTTTLPSSRSHPGITHRFFSQSVVTCSTLIFFKAKLSGNSNHFVTFLRITQEAPMGDSFCDIINGSYYMLFDWLNETWTIDGFFNAAFRYCHTVNINWIQTRLVYSILLMYIP